MFFLIFLFASLFLSPFIYFSSRHAFAIDFLVIFPFLLFISFSFSILFSSYYFLHYSFNLNVLTSTVFVCRGSERALARISPPETTWSSQFRGEHLKSQKEQLANTLSSLKRKVSIFYSERNFIWSSCKYLCVSRGRQSITMGRIGKLCSSRYRSVAALTSVAERSVSRKYANLSI
jgi:hypothetical protein